VTAPDTVTTLEAAPLLGLHHPDPAVLRGMVRRQLGRLGITPLHRQAGKGGESVWDAQQIQAALARRKPRGRPAKNREGKPR
jgi:hypothetical protein